MVYTDKLLKMRSALLLGLILMLAPKVHATPWADIPAADCAGLGGVIGWALPETSYSLCLISADGDCPDGHPIGEAFKQGYILYEKTKNTLDPSKSICAISYMTDHPYTGHKVQSGQTYDPSGSLPPNYICPGVGFCPSPPDATDQ